MYLTPDYGFMADPNAGKVIARDAPMSGSIPLAVGLPSVVRIPIPGTSGLCIEFRPRGYRPPGGSTSTLFFQDITGKRHLRLDYGYNVRTGMIDYHWNQKGTFDVFKVADHTPAGTAGEWLYQGAKYYRFGGRVFLIAGAAIDIYSIVVSSNPLRQTTKVVSAWAGAWATGEAAGAVGAEVGTAIGGPVGAAVGGLFGMLIGGFIGYETAGAAAGHVYDWADHAFFARLPEVRGR